MKKGKTMTITKTTKQIIIGTIIVLSIFSYYYYVFNSVPTDHTTGQRIQEVHTTQLVGNNGESLTSDEKQEYLNNQPHQTPEASPQQYTRVDNYNPDILTTTITTTKTINNE